MNLLFGHADVQADGPLVAVGFAGAGQASAVESAHFVEVVSVVHAGAAVFGRDLQRTFSDIVEYVAAIVWMY